MMDYCYKLRDRLKIVKQDIEFSMINGYYPMKSDVQDLLNIAEEAIEELLLDVGPL